MRWQWQFTILKPGSGYDYRRPDRYGKGRVAAAMIRYAVNQGVKPVFLTEKANLFSDIYRDLSAIGSGHLKPFM